MDVKCEQKNHAFSKQYKNMKPIPKSDRESNRYISCKITSSKSLTYDDFVNALQATSLQMVGKLGIGALGLQVVKDQYVFPTAIIKVNSAQLQVARAIICSIQTAPGQPIKVESITTSGTIHNVKPSKKTIAGKSKRK